MASIIKAENVSFRYQNQEDGPENVPAVKSVSFEVEEGEFVAVLGSNGSGKSTLAKLINALFVPTEGAVYVNGIDTRDEKRIWDVRSACGMVFRTIWLQFPAKNVNLCQKVSFTDLLPIFSPIWMANAAAENLSVLPVTNATGNFQRRI